MTNRERAELLKAVLQPCLKKSRNPEWLTYRYNTTYGTKTDEGLIQVIERICFLDDNPPDAVISLKNPENNQV